MKHPAGSSREVELIINGGIQVWTSPSPKRPFPPKQRIILYLKASSQTRIAVRIRLLIAVILLQCPSFVPNGANLTQRPPCYGCLGGHRRTIWHHNAQKTVSAMRFISVGPNLLCCLACVTEWSRPSCEQQEINFFVQVCFGEGAAKDTSN